mmetsp:Transcript_31474/g.90958  ORF Transcript_31474/g.90958 Transcript_31474/m.90958 type:complete len:1000 (+) Transcript_31474:98-3097(+)|eukprot:CAMPEP_0177166216 /NCGR_PEP_ID=MMETSP0367-20130122/7913_1 /TAXON_ID=447022 ORGANISM="Scrippsiella hangoei-like, Strain SHHI-4" /NCGR_SAMPLE_ID=MMETSP0367 /ASSEMBLY_ACC=CAM_ASM_000362 /LENGTH=999 /DNA_ID=CAMNT_0018612265 /DNA_START=14 /DNA_END=3013 /DNA_ORIENTATION=-
MAKSKKTGKQRLDKFYTLAKDMGYRSRASFKLIQLAKKNDFLSKAQVCIDLCSAPGGWCQVAQKHMASGSTIIGIDLCPMKAIHGVTCIQSDITSDKCRSLLKKELLGKRADVVLHDGAPNVGANWVKDAYAQNELVLHAMKLACEQLRVGGNFVTKVFRSQDYNSLMWVFSQLFNKVEATKPTASRNVSAEIFVMCLGFKGGKIDPKFYEPKWVFMEMLDPLANEDSKAPNKSAGASLSDYLKNAKKKHRSGYELGDDLKIIPAADYVSAPNPAEVLVTHHRISLTAKGSEHLDAHVSTTDEIRELCADLKVLGKTDLTKLLKWRMKIKREQEKVERAARKAEQEAAGGAATGQATKTGVTKGAVAQDVDAAIDELLDEDGVKSKAKAKGGDNSDEEHAADEKLEDELAEQVDKRRKEERRDAKKTMERQKKQEFRRKMSLGNTKESSQDQPELFKANNKSILALENQELYLDPTAMDSPGESSSGEEEPEDSSDDELDRYAKLEVDLAVDHQLRKMRNEDKYRTMQQRIRKKKKETRRQRVMQAWAGELGAFHEALDQKAGDEMAIRNKDSDDEDDDDNDSEDDLAQLRRLQDGPTGSSTVDVEALQFLLDGPGKGDADDESGDGGDGDDDEDGEDGEGKPRKGASKSSSSTALVAVGEDGDDLKAEHRMARWFSQDIFKSAGGSTALAKPKSTKMIPIDRDSEEEDSGGEGGTMRELSDDKLPKLPLTDKEKRKLKRKKDTERSDARGKGKKLKGTEEEDTTPMEIAPLEPPRPLVPRVKKDPLKPDDPQELAETLALGSILAESKKSRMDIIDAAYNRWNFEDDPLLPDWFTEEESRYNRPELPISKELMAQFRAKLREINARPIRKVTEARARKKRRLGKRLEKLRSTAMNLADSGDMSELAKARQMRKAVSKMAKQDERKVTVVNIKKGGGGKTDTKGGKVPKGSKVKVVDKRMKSDIRGLKKAAARNKSKHKVAAKKKMVKAQSKGKKGGKK